MRESDQRERSVHGFGGWSGETAVIQVCAKARPEPSDAPLALGRAKAAEAREPVRAGLEPDAAPIDGAQFEEAIHGLLGLNGAVVARRRELLR
jgi:hypothetical protein